MCHVICYKQVLQINHFFKALGGEVVEMQRISVSVISTRIFFQPKKS